MDTEWHICVSKLTIIGSDNGLSPGRHQAIIWTNAVMLLIERPLGTNFSENFFEIYTFSFKKMHLKMSSGKCRPFGLSLIVIMILPLQQPYLPCLPADNMTLHMLITWPHDLFTPCLTKHMQINIMQNIDRHNQFVGLSFYWWLVVCIQSNETCIILIFLVTFTYWY